MEITTAAIYDKTQLLWIKWIYPFGKRYWIPINIGETDAASEKKTPANTDLIVLEVIDTITTKVIVIRFKLIVEIKVNKLLIVAEDWFAIKFDETSPLGNINP